MPVPAEPDSEALASTLFDQLPPEMNIRAFGVDYGHVRIPGGGDLYVSRLGWPWVAQLLPAQWYADEWYARQGEKLPGATGCVYRVLTRPVRGRGIDLVVKFSRVAQHMSLEIETTFPDSVSPQEIAEARFNSPIEEFGLLMELRGGRSGPQDLRVMAQRPLAIYVPPDEYEAWQLGRSSSCFYAHRSLLAKDQEEAAQAIDLDIRRVYVLLYGWIKGINAEEAYLAEDISQDELLGLTSRVIAELAARGFRVLDNKPKHFIVRRRKRDGSILRRNGEIAYAVVDYELLQRTPECQRRFKAEQRARYWQMQGRRSDEEATPLPAHLKRVRVFGVNYIFGDAPDGGKLWVVGNDPNLFDYFLPERWRRTPRVKLALTNEVYRTRTRDNIHVVYRRSRVGERPRIDPIHGLGKRIREHGFNSPFEEVAIAEMLRQMGILTTYPRAIYRTGHQSTKAGYLRDERRYLDHAHLVTPATEPEPVLSAQYDYFTIWGYFRGIDPLANYLSRGHPDLVDLDKAREDGLITEDEYERTLRDTQRRLAAIGIAGERLDDHEFVLSVTSSGMLRRDERGNLDVTLCMDALTAFECGLVDERQYRDLVERVRAKLAAVDCEALDLGGNHLLLSMDPDGQLRRDERGEPLVALCNFELIRGLYRPIH
jgi:hypothetical protein